MDTPMTQLGYNLLHEELRELKHVRRTEVMQRIHEALQLGDLKENAEYHAAKEEQGFVEARIRTLNNALAHARVISSAHVMNKEIIVFGARVTLLKQRKKVSYQIVSSEESLIIPHTISVHAPLTKLLIGKKVGDKVILELEKKVTYTVMAIAYDE